jgi:hypothetical protein
MSHATMASAWPRRSVRSRSTAATKEGPWRKPVSGSTPRGRNRSSSTSRSLDPFIAP